MTVHKKLYWTTFKGTLNELLGVINFRVLHRTRILPLSVKIIPRERCPIVPYDHPVRIQHRNDLEYVNISQISSVFMIRH